MRRYYARRETRQSSTAILRNGMPRANRPRRTSRTGKECHLPMGGSPFMKNYDNRPLFYNANDAITANWLPHKPHVSPSLELRAAAMQCECAEFDAHHGAIDIAIYSDIAAISTTKRIHDWQPRRQIEAYETQFYRPTPSGRRRRLGAPWLPIRTSLRCLPPKRDSICCGAYAPKRYELRCGAYAPKRSELCCGAYAPKRYELRCGAYAPKRYELCCGVYHQSTTIRCGVSHQSSTTLYAEVLANQSYELCGGVYHQCTTTYAAVLMRQCSTSYAEVFYTEALQGCCSFYTKAAKTRCGVYTKAAEC